MAGLAGATVHLLRLDTIGGVERDFVTYLGHPTVRAGDHRVLVVGRRVHPHLRPALAGSGARVDHLRYWRRLKLPAHPRALRQARLRALLREHAPARVVAWNHFGDSALALLCAEAGVPLVYYEHGAGWLRPVAAAAGFLDRVAGVVCNADAAARLLAERFGWNGPTRVHHYGLRSDAQPSSPQRKQAPVGRRWRIGMAGRMIPLKGHPVALQALRALREAGHEAELHLAGGGPDEGALRRLAQDLGLGERVRFHGVVADMPGFYREIDLLVVPSLREPFGLVSIEAAAWGCPVVVAAVDGLGETLEPGVTGLALPATRPLADYPAIGGSLDGLPELVYHAAEDALGPPRFIDPAALAAAVAGLCVDADRFRAMSAAAGERIPARFDFDRHVLELQASFVELSSPTARAGS